MIPFAKYHGLGNDFIIIREEDVPGFTAAHAVRICDRHLGIGADGVLLVRPNGSGPAMRVWNADGSRPEMCGNGLRCVALYWWTANPTNREFVVQTDSGPHRCVVQEDRLVDVSMRIPSLNPEDIFIEASAEVIAQPFEVGSDRVAITAVSMGNPHVVTFDDVGDRRFELGPALERHPRFAQGANVGFARLETNGIELSVWERGVGWTQACGTGACAAAVAAVETGRAQRDTPISVRQPGGGSTVVVPDRGHSVRLIGPAEHVFDGTLVISMQGVEHA